MRILFFLAIFQLHVVVFGQTPNSTTITSLDSIIKQSIGKPFPNFVAVNENGKSNNDSLFGKVVLINFWFEGCAPCLAEFSALNKLAQKLKTNKGFEFISFTWDDAVSIERVKKKYKLQFKVFSIDEKECRRLNQNNGYPTTIILDRQGKIKYLFCGGSTDLEKANKFVINDLLPKIEKEL